VTEWMLLAVILGTKYPPMDNAAPALIRFKTEAGCRAVADGMRKEFTQPWFTADCIPFDDGDTP
jgi:hypothetical protein